MLKLAHRGLLPKGHQHPFRSSSSIRLFSDKGDKQKDSKEVQQHAKKDVSRHTPKPAKSAPAQMSPEVGMMMKKDMKPYIPKLKHDRVSYEYPGLPNQDEFTKHSSKAKQPKPVSRWSRYMPKILTAIVVAWGAYAVKVWYFVPEEESSSKELLDPKEFHKFIITHKQQIDKDHFLVEVRPKYQNWQYSYYAHYDTKSIWGGDRMWSVEIKQPEIMVVRSYTPLPLYFMKSERTMSGEKEPLLRVINNDADDYDKGGTMTFYIKRYADGEVSRYIVDKEIGDELDIRGPHVEFKFPHHPLNLVHERPIFRDLPSKVEAETLLQSLKRENNIPDYDNLVFFGAGTGIAPILQVLFSRNPYRGFVTVHYSARSTSEFSPFRRLAFFLEKLDRVKFVEHIDGQARLSAKDIKSPAERAYVSPMREEIENTDATSEESKLKLRMAIMDGTFESAKKPAMGQEREPWYENALQQAQQTLRVPKADAGLAIVCGPDGYIDYVAGGKDRATGEQGLVQGLLKKQGWNSKNVYKL